MARPVLPAGLHRPGDDGAVAPADHHPRGREGLPLPRGRHRRHRAAERRHDARGDPDVRFPERSLHVRVLQRGRSAGPRSGLHDRGEARRRDRGAGHAGLRVALDRDRGLPVAVELLGRGRDAHLGVPVPRRVRGRRLLGHRPPVLAVHRLRLGQADAARGDHGAPAGALGDRAAPAPRGAIRTRASSWTSGRRRSRADEVRAFGARAAERRGHVREPTDDPVRRARRAAALVRRGVDPVPGRRRADRRRDRSAGPRTHPGPGARLGRRGQRPARTPRDRTRLGPLPADRRAGRARAAGAAELATATACRASRRSSSSRPRRTPCRVRCCGRRGRATSRRRTRTGHSCSSSRASERSR